MRAITGPEKDAFISDYPSVTEGSIPPWGGVTEWHGLRVLVFFDANHQMRLSDITDRPDLLSDLPRYWNEYASSWWYQLPSTFVTRVAEVYNVAEDAIGNVTSPTGLASIAVIVVAIAALILWPRR